MTHGSWLYTLGWDKIAHMLAHHDTSIMFNLSFHFTIDSSCDMQGSTLAVFRYPENPRFPDGIPDSPEQ